MLDEAKRAKFQEYLKKIDITSLERQKDFLELLKSGDSSINERLFKDELAKAFARQYLELTQEDFEELRVMWNEKLGNSIPLELKPPVKEKVRSSMLEEKARNRFQEYLNAMSAPMKGISEPKSPIKLENESEDQLEQRRQAYGFTLMGWAMLPKDNEAQFGRAIAEAFKPDVMEYGRAKKADPNFQEFRKMWNEKWGSEFAVELEPAQPSVDNAANAASTVSSGEALTQKAPEEAVESLGKGDGEAPKPLTKEEKDALEERQARTFGLLFQSPLMQTIENKPPTPIQKAKPSVLRDIAAIGFYTLLGAGIGAGFGLLGGPAGVAAGAALGAAIGAGVGAGLVILNRLAQRWLAKHPEQQARVDEMNAKVTNRFGIGSNPPSPQIGQQNTQTVATPAAIVPHLENQKNSGSVKKEEPAGSQTPPSDKKPGLS